MSTAMPVDYEAIWSDVWGDMQKYGPIHRHHRRIFTQMISDVPKEDILTIADIGCGEGSNLAYLKKVFPRARLFGVDVSRRAIEKAKTLVDAEFVVLDAQGDYPLRSFDFVISSDVVEHLEDDMSALRNIYRITNKYALVASVQGRMRDFEKTIGHVRSYAYGELQAKLASVGFQVVKVVEWGFPLYSPLYRELFNIGSVEGVSHGRYGLVKRLLCEVLYVLFFLNRSDKGDIIFVLVRK
jgi:SAM-dependent methyltransferase